MTEKITNADRIRSMNDEDLADEIFEFMPSTHMARWEVLEWLKQEVD